MTFPRIRKLQTVDRHFESLDPRWDQSLTSWPLNKLIFLATFLVLVTGDRTIRRTCVDLDKIQYYNASFPYLDIFTIQSFSEICHFKSRVSMSIYLIPPQLINVYCLQKKMDENNILPEMRKKLCLRT